MQWKVMARTRAASRKNLRGTPRQAAAAAVARLQSPSASIEVKNTENFRVETKTSKSQNYYHNLKTLRLNIDVGL